MYLRITASTDKRKIDCEAGNYAMDQIGEIRWMDFPQGFTSLGEKAGHRTKGFLYLHHRRRSLNVRWRSTNNDRTEKK